MNRKTDPPTHWRHSEATGNKYRDIFEAIRDRLPDEERQLCLSEAPDGARGNDDYRVLEVLVQKGPIKALEHFTTGQKAQWCRELGLSVESSACTARLLEYFGVSRRPKLAGRYQLMRDVERAVSKLKQRLPGRAATEVIETGRALEGYLRRQLMFIARVVGEETPEDLYRRLNPRQSEPLPNLHSLGAQCCLFGQAQKQLLEVKDSLGMEFLGNLAKLPRRNWPTKIRNDFAHYRPETLSNDEERGKALEFLQIILAYLRAYDFGPFPVWIRQHGVRDEGDWFTLEYVVEDELGHEHRLVATPGLYELGTTHWILPGGNPIFIRPLSIGDVDALA
ncbi:MAG: hypothetical protein H6702_11720 [Myxococcales bacterium]|nr:hypothetical protein [Myxococcales bacterium]